MGSSKTRPGGSSSPSASTNGFGSFLIQIDPVDDPTPFELGAYVGMSLVVGHNPVNGFEGMTFDLLATYTGTSWVQGLDQQGQMHHLVTGGVVWDLPASYGGGQVNISAFAGVNDGVGGLAEFAVLANPTHDQTIVIGDDTYIFKDVLDELDTPPVAPNPGDDYLIGPNPEEGSDWEGHANAHASWVSEEAGWGIADPLDGEIFVPIGVTPTASMSALADKSSLGLETLTLTGDTDLLIVNGIFDDGFLIPYPLPVGLGGTVPGVWSRLVEGASAGGFRVKRSVEFTAANVGRIFTIPLSFTPIDCDFSVTTSVGSKRIVSSSVTVGPGVLIVDPTLGGSLPQIGDKLIFEAWS